jgi:MraZ protein
VAFRLQTGEFESKLDEKGRVVIPACLRDRYAGELVITKGKQNCAWIMTPDAWTCFEERLKKNASQFSGDEYEALYYQYVIPAKVAEIDPKSGRVPVHAAVRTYAGLGRDCLVLNTGDHLEVWDSQAFYKHMEEKKSRILEATNKLGPRLFSPAEEQAE